MNPAETYILAKPEPFRGMLLHLAAVIQTVLPNADMKFKWGLPCFYVGKHPICYLNAPVKKGFVDVAFWNSAHLTRHQESMVSEKRKVVKSLRYRSLEEIDNTVLTDVLLESYALREKGFWANK